MTAPDLPACPPPDPSAVAYWTAWLRESRTEPMSQAELADWFGVDKTNVAVLLAGIGGLEAVAVGSRTKYTLPVLAMPAAYTARHCPFPRHRAISSGPG